VFRVDDFRFVPLLLGSEATFSRSQSCQRTKEGMHEREEQQLLPTNKKTPLPILPVQVRVCCEPTPSFHCEFVN
jgi:hypothetical protein